MLIKTVFFEEAFNYIYLIKKASVIAPATSVIIIAVNSCQILNLDDPIKQ